MSENGSAPAVTDEQILEKFLACSDDQWPLVLIEHPHLATILRAQIEGLIAQRLAMIELLREIEMRLEAERDRLE